MYQILLAYVWTIKHDLIRICEKKTMHTLKHEIIITI